MEWKKIFIVICIISLFVPTFIFTQQRRPNRQIRGAINQEVLYLTPDQESETLTYIQRYYPDRLNNLENIKSRRPEAYRQWLSRAFREMRFMNELKDRDSERYNRMVQEKELDKKSRELSKQYRESTDDDEKAQLRIEIEELLDQIFEIRQMNRQAEIERLELRLAELKENNQKRLENKEVIIQRRLDRMLGQDDDMEW